MISIYLLRFRNSTLNPRGNLSFYVGQVTSKTTDSAGKSTLKLVKKKVKFPGDRKQIGCLKSPGYFLVSFAVLPRPKNNDMTS